MLGILNHLFAAVCGQNPDHTWAPGGVLLPCCQRCLGLYVGGAIAAWLHFGLRPVLSGRFLKIHGAFLLLMAPFGFHWLPQGPVLRTVSGVLFGFGLVAFLLLPMTDRFSRREFSTQNRRGAEAQGFWSAVTCHRFRTQQLVVQSGGTSPAEAKRRPVGALQGLQVAPSRLRAFALNSDGKAASEAGNSAAGAGICYSAALVATVVGIPFAASLDARSAAYLLSGLVFCGLVVLGLLVFANLGLGAVVLRRSLVRFAHE